MRLPIDPPGKLSGNGFLEYDTQHYPKPVYHPGVDLSNKPGNQDLNDPVYAVADGIVTFAGGNAKTGFGYHIVIAHPSLKVWSHYGHLNKILVSSGFVKEGDVIGRLGTTGASTGVHIHFELRTQELPPDAWPGGKSIAYVKARYTDPIKFINDHPPMDQEFEDAVKWAKDTGLITQFDQPLTDTRLAVILQRFYNLLKS